MRGAPPRSNSTQDNYHITKVWLNPSTEKLTDLITLGRNYLDNYRKALNADAALRAAPVSLALGCAL